MWSHSFCIWQPTSHGQHHAAQESLNLEFASLMPRLAFRACVRVSVHIRLRSWGVSWSASIWHSLSCDRAGPTLRAQCPWSRQQACGIAPRATVFNASFNLLVFSRVIAADHVGMLRSMCDCAHCVMTVIGIAHAPQYCLCLGATHPGDGGIVRDMAIWDCRLLARRPAQQCVWGTGAIRMVGRGGGSRFRLQSACRSPPDRDAPRGTPSFEVWSRMDTACCLVCVVSIRARAKQHLRATCHDRWLVCRCFTTRLR